MKVRVEIVETLRKFVDVDVDAMDEQEIQAEVDYLFAEWKIDMNRYDSYECDTYIVGKVTD